MTTCSSNASYWFSQIGNVIKCWKYSHFLVFLIYGGKGYRERENQKSKGSQPQSSKRHLISSALFSFYSGCPLPLLMCPFSHPAPQSSVTSIGIHALPHNSADLLLSKSSIHPFLFFPVKTWPVDKITLTGLRALTLFVRLFIFNFPGEGQSWWRESSLAWSSSLLSCVKRNGEKYIQGSFRMACPQG